jgi:hypothetical protein
MAPITISKEEHLMNLTQITIGEADTMATKTQVPNMNIGLIAKSWNWKVNIEQNHKNMLLVRNKEFFAKVSIYSLFLTALKDCFAVLTDTNLLY